VVEVPFDAGYMMDCLQRDKRTTACSSCGAFIPRPQYHDDKPLCRKCWLAANGIKAEPVEPEQPRPPVVWTLRLRK